MKGMGGGMQQLMKQANQMQSRMKKAQEELSSLEFKGSSGGESVIVTVNCDCLIQNIEIQPEVLESGDQEMLQDLLMTAANDAIQQARETYQKEMTKITGGGLPIPGML